MDIFSPQSRSRGSGKFESLWGMRKSRTWHARALCAVTSALFCINAANADIFGFEAITANSIIDPGIAESQLSVEVTDYTANWQAAHGGVNNAVLFTFNNAGPLASSITDVYFDDGSLLDLAALWDSDDDPLNGWNGSTVGDPNVDYSEEASPGDLPGGNAISPRFDSTSGFLADADPPVVPNGVNPNQWLGIVFTLQLAGDPRHGTEFNRTFQDVLDELADGRLRIGIHVQGFADGDSESLVNNPDPIPAPGAAMLGMFGLAAVSSMKRRLS